MEPKDLKRISLKEFNALSSQGKARLIHITVNRFEGHKTLEDFIPVFTVATSEGASTHYSVGHPSYIFTSTSVGGMFSGNEINHLAQTVATEFPIAYYHVEQD